MTLPAYLDAVEQGRIPADEIQHRTRLARTALKKLLNEGSYKAGLSEAALKHALDEAVRAEREACAVLLNEQADVLRAELTVWDEHEGSVLQAQIEAIEDAVSAIRSRPSPDVAVVPSLRKPNSPELLAHAERIINSPEHVERVERDVKRAAPMPKDHWLTAMMEPESPPPDLAAMRRVVEAARAVIVAAGRPGLDPLFLALQPLRDALSALPGGEP